MSQFEKAINDAADEQRYLESLRRTGRTTRLADQYIQDLFNNPGKWIVLCDHDNGNINHLSNVINKRLALEHPGLYSSSLIEVSLTKIRLLANPTLLARVNKALGV